MLEATADEDEGFEFELSGDACAGLAADDPAFHLGELPFALFGEQLEEVFADDESEDSISEEFEAFVGIESSFGGGAVCEAAAQELFVAEFVLNSLFAGSQLVLNHII